MAEVAVVTGSNRGIGYAIALALQGAGYAVVTNGRSTLKGPGDLHVRADVATPAGARRLIAKTRRRFSRLDVLVNNVGDFRETPVSDLRTEDWAALLDSNLKTAWYCCREALPLLRRQGGVVVTIGTPMAHVARANPRAVGYQMAKTALAVFTKSLAQAEAPRGIRANMVSPGYIRTYAWTRREIAQKAPRIPARRMGEPEEVARAVVWLASDQAAYVNGAVLDVGGGLWV